MNYSGTSLSYSDMLFSIAVSQWKRNAREEILDLVTKLNEKGGSHFPFSFSKDWVLKAGLMLCGFSVRFKADNFVAENMRRIEENWEDIKYALELAVGLAHNFGFSGKSLTANNAMLPIAYYLYLKKPGENYLLHSNFECDRQAIRKWLVRSLLKQGVWRYSVDRLLSGLREVIRKDQSSKFPANGVYDEMAERGKDLVFDEHEINRLLDIRYGDRHTFALLSLLFPYVDLERQPDIDHIFPTKAFSPSNLKSIGVPEDKIDDFVDKKDRLANLQLLDGTKNKEKRDRVPAAWLEKTYPNPARRRHYEDDHLLGDVPETIAGFGILYNERRKRLKAELEKHLGR